MSRSAQIRVKFSPPLPLAIELNWKTSIRSCYKNILSLTLLKQNKAEAEEELIANTLFKRLEALEEQKNKLLTQLEQEEEYLTNTLQKRQRDVRLAPPAHLYPLSPTSSVGEGEGQHREPA